MKIVVRLLCLVTLLMVFVFIAVSVFGESWLKNNITSTLNKTFKNYHIEMEKLNVSFLPPTIELNMVNITSKSDTGDYMHLEADLSSLKLAGINAMKVILKKDIEIDEFIIADGRIKSTLKNIKKENLAVLFPRTIKVGKIVFDKINVEITRDSSPRKYEVREATLSIYDVHVLEKDTITMGFIKLFDFKATELLSVSSDSMYLYKGSNVMYSQKTLSIGNLTIHPNFSNYDFTSRSKYQTDRISAEVNDILIHDLEAVDCLNVNMVSSYIQVGKMDMKIFSDKRRPFHHRLRSIFPEMIYNYSGKLKIDSLTIKNGVITYTERSDGSLADGSIRFTNINANIFNISNNPVYKSKEDSLKFFITSLLMGKAPLYIVLKSKIFDKNNTLYVSGSLHSMDIQDLNPFLEKTEFIHINSGKLNKLNFKFVANNYKSSGQLIVRYNDLAISYMKMKKGLAAALSGILFNILCNTKLLNENPMPGKELRVGIIDYKRDPERFVISYLLKSVMSGIKSSLMKSPKKKKKTPQTSVPGNSNI